MAERESAILLADHMKALEESHGKGFAAGQEEAETGIVAQLETLHLTLLDLIAEQTRHRQKSQMLLAGILQTSLAKLFPALAQQGALEEVLETVGRVFESEVPAQEITISVALGTADKLQERLRVLKEEHDQPLTFKVQEDPELCASDCRLDWEGGGLERLSARLYQEIETCLARLGVTEHLDEEPEKDKEVTRGEKTEGKEEAGGEEKTTEGEEGEREENAAGDQSAAGDGETMREEAEVLSEEPSHASAPDSVLDSEADRGSNPEENVTKKDMPEEDSPPTEEIHDE